jgi:glycosidase
MRTALAMAVTAAALTACAPGPKTGIDSSDAIIRNVSGGMHPTWSRNAVIYEVNIRQYTPEGTFAAFQKQLPRLRNLGIDVLWFMPIQPIGKLNRKGTLGSYYSIRDYTAINPEFGTEADFKALVDAAHAQGFKVILDWVANHTAFDHEWTSAHRDWYTIKPDGSISRAIGGDGKETDWSDVADLNYASAPMRQAMIADMKWWLETMNLDGFRCDMAGLVPADFWTEVRAALDPVKKDLFFLAEWEDPALHRSFDATYSWELFHLMNDIASGKKPVGTLDTLLAKQDSLYAATDYRLTFTSNHDENSWAGTEFERMGPNHKSAYVVSALLARSMPLLYSGQEASFNRRLQFFEKDSVDWSGATLEPFYRTLFSLRHEYDVLWSGPWGASQVRLTTDQPDKVFAFSRSRGRQSVVVLANFGSAPVTVKYSGFTQPGEYLDFFNGTPATLDTAGTVLVQANDYRVFAKR